MKSVPFAAPDITEKEISAVVEVLRSGWLTTGDQCRAFEAAFADAVGASYAVAVNSGTAALHLSLEALGVGKGDLVFMSPYTFAATAEVVRYRGAIPVFVDIDPLTLNIDPIKLRVAIFERLDGRQGQPRAIIPVHMAGLPCDMDAIWSIARETNLAVVEDAAHAFPAAYKGRPIGSIPAGIRGTTCFSFYATKTITTGEGGMLTTEDEEIADRARCMSLHGLSRQAWSRYETGSGWAYDIVAPGFKYNLTDIAAALGQVQLRRAEEMRGRRRNIAETYAEKFRGIKGLQRPWSPPEVDHAWHLYILRVTPEILGIARDNLILQLSKSGIGTSVHFIPLHLHSYYRDTFGYRPDDFPEAHRQYLRAVSLPIFSAMTDAQCRQVIEAVIEIATTARLSTQRRSADPSQRVENPVSATGESSGWHLDRS